MKVLVCFLALFAGPLYAQQTTYIYTGQPMGSNIATGTVTLAQPLAANGVQQVTPISSDFTGNLGIATGAPNTNFYATSFSFTTQKGVITQWTITTFGTAGSTVATLSLTDLGDSYELAYYSPDCSLNPDYCVPPVITSNTTPGTWSIPQAQVATAMAALQTQVSTLTTQNASLTVERNSYLHGYIAENAIIAEQNAALVQLKLSVYYLNALVAKCRADQGMC